jgi:hypothetical protein
MRMPALIAGGLVAAVVVLAVPVLAKNANVQKADDKAASSSCRAYQQAPDGSWTALPCQETGASAPTDPKPRQRAADGAR